ncbi:MAG: hypothetical protein ACYDAQ_12385 [Mycobacteriales bacterium]
MDGSPAAAIDPRHTFLAAREVMARYGWGRTKGYEMLRDPRFPRPLAGNRYRLDTLMAWEDTQLAGAAAPVAPLRPAFPPRKRPGRKARA